MPSTRAGEPFERAGKKNYLAHARTSQATTSRSRSPRSSPRAPAGRRRRSHPRFALTTGVGDGQTPSTRATRARTLRRRGDNRVEFQEEVHARPTLSDRQRNGLYETRIESQTGNFAPPKSAGWLGSPSSKQSKATTSMAIGGASSFFVERITPSPRQAQNTYTTRKTRAPSPGALLF